MKTKRGNACYKETDSSRFMAPQNESLKSKQQQPYKIPNRIFETLDLKSKFLQFLSATKTKSSQYTNILELLISEIKSYPMSY